MTTDGKLCITLWPFLWILYVFRKIKLKMINLELQFWNWPIIIRYVSTLSYIYKTWTVGCKRSFVAQSSLAVSNGHTLEGREKIVVAYSPILVPGAGRWDTSMYHNWNLEFLLCFFTNFWNFPIKTQKN